MTARLSQVLLALVCERFWRFSTYLEDVSLTCSDAERRLVDFLDVCLLEVNERKIKRATRILSLPELVEAEESDAINLLISAAAHMDILLSETEVFPRQRPPLEVYDFLNKAFPEVLTNGWELAVVLWPIYNFGADPDLTERLKKALDWMPEQPPKHVVLYLAEIERNNPTMWSLLAHEMGHALDEAKKIGDNILGTEALAQIDVPRWITELVADTIAIKVLGPAYFCALAFLTLLDDDPTHYSPSHPALYKRVEMLKQELERMGVLEGETKETVNGYYQMVMERTKDKLPNADWEYSWNDIFIRVKEVVDVKVDEVQPFSRENRERSEALAKLLHKGIPISSFLDEEHYRSINEEATQLLHNLKETSGANRQRRLDEFKRQLDKIIDDFIEEPTHPIQILNAGWVDRWDEIKDWCSRSGSTSKWLEQLQKGDAILKKSIEAISVHEELRRNKDDPQ